MLITLLLAAQGLSNGDFSQWKDGGPVGWTLSIGATAGEGGASVVEPSDGGLRMRGDAGTRIWRFVSQRRPLGAGETLRLRFRARATGLDPRGHRYPNHNVGLFAYDASGQRLGGTHLSPTADVWTPEEILWQTPERTASVEVYVFLSMTGTLEAGGLSLERLTPEDSYDVLVAHMDRYYSHFALKGVDWAALAKKHRAKASDPAGFVGAIQGLLAELKDEHVWVAPPGGAVRPTHRKPAPPNFDLAAVERALDTPRTIADLALVGRAAGNIGYVAVKKLSGDAADIDRLEKAIENLFDAPALILDLRANIGGDELVAQRLVAMLVDRPTVYARQVYRAGAEHDRFTPPQERAVVPREGPRYAKPVVALIGPVCMSSGEGFALMLKARPNTRLVGRPTRGSSGNPRPVRLPNGVAVHFSRWVSQAPDGTPLEDRGVRPDVEVNPRGTGDPTFQRALELLSGAPK